MSIGNSRFLFGPAQLHFDCDAMSKIGKPGGYFWRTKAGGGIRQNENRTTTVVDFTKFRLSTDAAADQYRDDDRNDVTE